MKQKFIRFSMIASAVTAGAAALWLFFPWGKINVDMFRPKDVTIDREGEKMTTLDSKNLVVYFTRSGRTQKIAQWIQEAAQADLIEIKVVSPYPAEYSAVVKQASFEIKTGVKPELTTKIDNLAKYDVIFIGTPCWWSTIAPPVASLLSKYDFSGKTIVPFVTHGGSGLASCAADMKKLAPNATFLDALVIRDSNIDNAKNQTVEWTKKSLANK